MSSGLYKGYFTPLGCSSRPRGVPSLNLPHLRPSYLSLSSPATSKIRNISRHWHIGVAEEIDQCRVFFWTRPTWRPYGSKQCSMVSWSFIIELIAVIQSYHTPCCIICFWNRDKHSPFLCMYGRPHSQTKDAKDQQVACGDRNTHVCFLDGACLVRLPTAYWGFHSEAGLGRRAFCVLFRRFDTCECGQSWDSHCQCEFSCEPVSPVSDNGLYQHMIL